MLFTHEKKTLYIQTFWKQNRESGIAVEKSQTLESGSGIGAERVGKPEFESGIGVEYKLRLHIPAYKRVK